jgi:hypothetical protein
VLAPLRPEPRQGPLVHVVARPAQARSSHRATDRQPQPPHLCSPAVALRHTGVSLPRAPAEPSPQCPDGPPLHAAARTSRYQRGPWYWWARVFNCRQLINLAPESLLTAGLQLHPVLHGTSSGRHQRTARVDDRDHRDPTPHLRSLDQPTLGHTASPPTMTPCPLPAESLSGPAPPGGPHWAVRASKERGCRSSPPAR